MKYKLLGNSGLRVSELCLGTMTFGEDWGYGADENSSREIFHSYLGSGGNFIDTANRYTEGTSEEYIGKFIKESGRRDELVIATKYGLYTKSGRINDSGNHRKNMVQSLEGSLKRLGLEYVDILYLHIWDFTTPIEEILRALDDLVRAGKVLYPAISDTPAWIVSKGNQMAKHMGWSPFVGLQAEYSLITRDAERDLLPMAESEGLGFTAWAPIAGGALSGKYLNNSEQAGRLKEGSKRLNERSQVIAKEVVDSAKEIGCSPVQLAIGWMLKKSPNIFPIIGSRKLDQIKDAMGSIEVSIPAEIYERLETVSAIDLGFPHEFYKQDGVKLVTYGGLRDQIDL